MRRSFGLVERGIAIPMAAALVLSVAVVLAVTERPSAAMTRDDAVTSAAAYALDRGYRTGVAVLDTATGRTYGAGYYGSAFASESLVKVFIAARLLALGKMTGSTATLAYRMITRSDDAAATALYSRAGGDSIVPLLEKRYHIEIGSPPSSAGWWGNTHITPIGMVRFYDRAKKDAKVGHWLLNAMHHATVYGSDGQYQYFGLPQATSGAAIKQGWGNDWSGGGTADFNTSGYVNDDRFAVAILMRGPSYTYGSQISSMLTASARRLLPNGHFPADYPTISGLSQQYGPIKAGKHVRIYGTSFTSISKVMFGSAQATVVGVGTAHTWIEVVAPAHAAGKVDVRVATTHGWSAITSADRYQYVAPPTVTSVVPNTGPVAGGTQLTIAGTNFTMTTTVQFGADAAASVVRVSSTQLTVVTPAHSAGAVDVLVSTPYGTVTAAAAFTFVEPDTGGSSTRHTSPSQRPKVRTTAPSTSATPPATLTPPTP